MLLKVNKGEVFNILTAGGGYASEGCKKSYSEIKRL
jgi:hypothetical protein